MLRRGNLAEGAVAKYSAFHFFDTIAPVLISTSIAQ